MDTSELLARRLISQGLAPTPAREGMRNGRDVAARLLALQAQNYPAGIRALGLRCGLDDAAITDEVRTLELVRSWPQRGTLHFLHAADVRWMSKLLYPRVANSQRGRRAALGLSEEMVTRARQALLEAGSSPPNEERNLRGILRRRNRPRRQPRIAPAARFWRRGGGGAGATARSTRDFS